MASNANGLTLSTLPTDGAPGMDSFTPNDEVERMKEQVETSIREQLKSEMEKMAE